MSKSNNRPTGEAAAVKMDPISSIVLVPDRTALPSGRYTWTESGNRHQVCVKDTGDGCMLTSCRTRDLRVFFAGVGSVVKEDTHD